MAEKKEKKKKLKKTTAVTAKSKAVNKVAAANGKEAVRAAKAAGKNEKAAARAAKKADRAAGRKEKKKSIAGKVIGIFAAVLLLAAGGYLGACYLLGNSVIWEGTTVNGVSLDGMTKEQAAMALQAEYEAEYKDSSFTVKLADKEFEVPVYDALAIDFTDEINRVYETGHGEWYLRGYEWAERKIKGAKPGVVLPYLAHPETVAAVIEASGLPEFSNEVDSTWEKNGDGVIIHKGYNGIRADVEGLEKKIADTIASGKCSGSIGCPEAVAAIAALDMEPIAKALYKEPQNPTLDPSNNYAVVPAVTGITLDEAATKTAYDAAEQGEDVTAVISLTAPTESTEEFEEKLFSTMLTAYNTYASSSYAKSVNQTIACETVDNTILMPGETFSYLGLIGDTTPDKGYLMENAYADGYVVQEYGGGVCQVSSTIFSAILYTNLEIVERRNHSMLVGYVPQGMDATVSYPSPDFKFRNNRSYPILIRTIYDSGKIRCEIYGTPEETDREVDVDLSYVGELAVDTYRVYYDAEGNVAEREFVCASRYKPVNTKRPGEEDEESENEETDSREEDSDRRSDEEDGDE